MRRRRQVAPNGKVLGVSSFGFTSVHWGHDGQKVELKRIITQREYKVGAHCTPLHVAPALALA